MTAPAEPFARQAEMLANRVRKRMKHLGKWARREGVSCYRIYDRDIPEIPLAIDWYEGRVHVARFAREHGADDPRADERWLAAMADGLAAALDVRRDWVYVKERRRQRGKEQYERVDARGERFVVHEGGHRFWVNLADYLDTGLFLDHRLTRARVAREAAGARFLNLFCYTGSFTVYAAAGGAARSLSVDLSNTYLDWTADNLALNGLADERHQRLRGDILGLLDDGAILGPFDLAVLDPPTFSTSKGMRRALDIKRDHAPLIEQVLGLLRPGGVLYFSTNARGFRLDQAALGRARVEDLTAATVPPDFAGRASHRCWRIERR